MSQIKELLVDQLQDLLHAETQLAAALPAMAEAANCTNLKAAFEKHLVETQGQIQRLQQIFDQLGEPAEPKPCKAMMGLIAEGQETIEEGKKKKPMSADLALIAAAQRVEHYEISAYGTARAFARQLGEFECARLLTQTLGEEESADCKLTSLSDPLLQQLTLDDAGAMVNLESVNSDSKVSSSANPARKGKKAAA